MPIRYDQYNQTAVLVPDTDLGGANVDAFVRTARDVLARKNVASFVIDLEAARFIDGRGLESLLSLQRECSQRGGQVKLVGLDENCRTILEMTRLLRRFDCYPDQPAALRAAA